MYFAATSEQSVYSVEMLSGGKAIVRLAASEAMTPKNVGFPATTGVMNSPDNLAQDALGNIYIIEDAPNGESVGGDIWFMRDANTDGIAESLDHFMSIQIDGSEATGMIFNPAKPTQFVVAVQHPDTTADGAVVQAGFGDAIWSFDLENIAPPVCDRYGWRYEPTCTHAADYKFVELLQRTQRRDRDRRWNWQGY
jgi:secreted PhoX family phosphatase